MIIPWQPMNLCEQAEIVVCKQIWRHMAPYIEHAQIRNYNLWQQIDRNIGCLPLPKDSIKKLKGRSQLIYTWQISTDWRLKHLLRNVPFGEYIQWRKGQNIDTAKTLKTLYQNRFLMNSIQTWSLFTIHCVEACTEDCYAEIENLPKYSFRNCLHASRAYDVDIIKDVLRFYWNSLMQKGIEKCVDHLNCVFQDCDFYNRLDPFQVNLTLLSLRSKNIGAIEYFWQRLTDEQKIQVIDTALNHEFYIEHLFNSCRSTDDVYLVILLWRNSPSRSYKTFLLRIFQSDVLINQFLTSPWEEDFFDVIERVWPGLDDSDKEQGLLALCKVVTAYESYIYKDRFCEEKLTRIFAIIWPSTSHAVRNLFNFKECVSQVYDINF